MPYRTKNQNTLYLGEWNADCDRCGFKFKASDLREDWQGLMLCRDCYEPRHPSDFFRMPFEQEQIIPWSRPTASTALHYLTAEDGTYVTNPDGTFILLED